MAWSATMSYNFAHLRWNMSKFRRMACLSVSYIRETLFFSFSDPAFNQEIEFYFLMSYQTGVCHRYHYILTSMSSLTASLHAHFWCKTKGWQVTHGHNNWLTKSRNIPHHIKLCAVNTADSEYLMLDCIDYSWSSEAPQCSEVMKRRRKRAVGVIEDEELQ